MDRKLSFEVDLKAAEADGELDQAIESLEGLRRTAAAKRSAALGSVRDAGRPQHRETPHRRD
jgi:hypothetical protein